MFKSITKHLIGFIIMAYGGCVLAHAEPDRGHHHHDHHGHNGHHGHGHHDHHGHNHYDDDCCDDFEDEDKWAMHEEFWKTVSVRHKEGYEQMVQFDTRRGTIRDKENRKEYRTRVFSDVFRGEIGRYDMVADSHKQRLYMLDSARGLIYARDFDIKVKGDGEPYFDFSQDDWSKWGYGSFYMTSWFKNEQGRFRFCKVDKPGTRGWLSIVYIYDSKHGNTIVLPYWGEVYWHKIWKSGKRMCNERSFVGRFELDFDYDEPYLYLMDTSTGEEWHSMMPTYNGHPCKHSKLEWVRN